MLVQHFLENAAKRLPDKIALICNKERWTYKDLDSQANKLAHFLRGLGIQRQDRVAILLDNSTNSVISLFAALKCDAVFLMLSPTMKAAKLSYILNDCQVKLLITSTSKASVVSDAAAGAPLLEGVLWTDRQDQVPPEQSGSLAHHYFDEALAGDLPMPAPPASSNIDIDLAAIIYTSGSTGEPKGIMLTHLNMVSAATSITTYLANREDDIILDVLPLSFDYGLYQVLMAFKFGGTVVLERSFTYPFQVIQKMVEENVTGFPGVPTIFAILLGLKGLDKYRFPKLRYITNTAASLPPSYIAQLQAIFPDVRLYSMYGLTECKRVSFLPPEELNRRPTSVGRGMPNEEVWIADDAGNRVPPGTVGELVVRGSNVMRGYWGRPEETARALRPGKYPGETVLYTGDLFTMDEEGFLFFVGRKDDMIKSRGERISPKEVEHCLYALDGVAEAAVFGVPHDVFGQSIVAYVACRNGRDLSVNDVLTHCKSHLEDFMVPQAVHFVASFPKTATGKIDKRALKTLHA